MCRLNKCQDLSEAYEMKQSCRPRSRHDDLFIKYRLVRSVGAFGVQNVCRTIVTLRHRYAVSNQVYCNYYVSLSIELLVNDSFSHLQDGNDCNDGSHCQSAYCKAWKCAPYKKCENNARDVIWKKSIF